MTLRLLSLKQNNKKKLQYESYSPAKVAKSSSLVEFEVDVEVDELELATCLDLLFGAPQDRSLVLLPAVATSRLYTGLKSSFFLIFFFIWLAFV